MAAEADIRSKGEETRQRMLDAAERLVLARGYTGTSVDDILSATRLTKGAFFYHFKSKGDLARALIERFWRRHVELFERLWRRADELTDDPLQAVLIWFKLLEEQLDDMEESMVSCLFASCLYEREQFSPDVLGFIKDSFREWSTQLERRFERIFAVRQPKTPIAAEDLSEAAISLIEGGFVLGHSYCDPKLVIRQSEHFRRYLRLLFGD